MKIQIVDNQDKLIGVKERTEVDYKTDKSYIRSNYYQTNYCKSEYWFKCRRLRLFLG